MIDISKLRNKLSFKSYELMRTFGKDDEESRARSKAFVMHYALIVRKAESEITSNLRLGPFSRFKA